MKPTHRRCLKRSDGYRVHPVSFAVARDFVVRHHYAKGCANAMTGAFGLFDPQEKLVGVAMFHTPCSENVCASVFGPERKRSVTELHRLVLLDEAPLNAESFFLARANRQLKHHKPHLDAVLSFADETHGHVGVVYQSINAHYAGTTHPELFYRDRTGRLRHRRQCGVNIGREEAAARGWKPVRCGAKHRYWWALARHREKAHIETAVRLEEKPYPRRPEGWAPQWRQVPLLAA